MVPPIRNKYKSVNLVRTLLKIVGLWRPENKKEKRVMDIALGSCLLANFLAILVQTVDLYHVYTDLYLAMLNLSATLLLFIIVVKMSTFMYYRALIFDLISYAETNFWGVTYDDYGDRVLKECDKRAVRLTYVFCAIVQIAVLIWLFSPILEGRYRELPFKVWFDWPLKKTPYYQMAYTVQTFSSLFAAICTFCFDVFVACFNIHVAGQFRILGHKIEIVVDKYNDKVKKNEDVAEGAKSLCNNFKNCVRDHLKLIDFFENMEKAFTWILLGQLLLSSILICCGGFQFLAADTKVERCIFGFHFVGSMSQLYLYTWTCNDVTVQSSEVATAVYNMKWYLLPHDATGKFIKHGVLTVINRTNRPCIFTAGNFAPMTLETFKNVFSTAASYLTLLRQMSEET